MIDHKVMDELASKISGLVPPGVKGIQEDIEKSVQGVLQSAFSRMELVTREEFDVQSEVLSRTRSKLELLEKQVAALEKTVLNK
ncbi:MAG: accessory factor UbiK family protein [Gammaproteobacteria bacterium]|nr:accessory factor UbiK family protein [Gammaproteobacteria bacterium]MCF6230615.1 accessory factor UbiK family protein [Gammaproteobacteria bacterium]